MQATLALLDGPIADGVAEQRAWAEIGTILDRRVRLCDAERKRLQEVSGVVSSEEVAVMVARIADCLRQSIDDPATLERIAAELEDLVPADTIPLSTPPRRRRR
jgi:hypothetical protein